MFHPKTVTMEYRELKISGWQLLTRICLISISSNPYLGPKKIENRLLLHRCLFLEKKNAVYLYLTEPEIYFSGCLKSLPNELFLYGTCHLNALYQIKSSGVMKIIEGVDRKNILDLMERELRGEISISDNPRNLFDIKEREKALTLIKTKGDLFLFNPFSYSFRVIKKAS
jgi:hypothetical protein